MDIKTIVTELVNKSEHSSVSYSELLPIIADLDLKSLKEIEADLKSKGITFRLPDSTDPNDIVNTDELRESLVFSEDVSEEKRNKKVNSEKMNRFNRIFLAAYQLADDPEEKKEIQNIIVEANLNLVLNAGKGYMAHSYYKDAIQSGYIGLIEAVKHYDFNEKGPFGIYATKYWIRKGLNSERPKEVKKGVEVISLDAKSGDNDSDATPMELPSSDNIEQQSERREIRSEIVLRVVKYFEDLISREEEPDGEAVLVFLAHSGILLWDTKNIKRIDEYVTKHFDLKSHLGFYSLGLLNNVDYAFARLINVLAERNEHLPYTTLDVPVRFNEKELCAIHNAINNNCNQFMKLLFDLNYANQVCLIEELSKSYPDDIFTIAKAIGILVFSSDDIGSNMEIPFTDLSRELHLPIEKIKAMYESEEHIFKSYKVRGV